MSKSAWQFDFGSFASCEGFPRIPRGPDRSFSDTISNLERAISLPTYETLDALAKGLNVSLADFFSEDDTQSVARAEAMARLTDAARQLDDQTLKTAAAIVEVLAGEEGL